jgi:pyruvate/2-oxoglutarate dehydrogenase complex dihydrolipoamide dehydrogenase (E3) component
MENPENYKAIVIGTGQGGKPLAGSLARAGWKTAIIEREDKVGGTCVIKGCTPTKTMVASARVAHVARRAADYGVRTSSVDVDMVRVRERKRDIVDLFSGGGRRGLEKLEHLDLIFGHATFTGPNEIEIAPADGNPRRLTAEKIFINTGLRPLTPDIPGLKDLPYLDSTSIMELDSVPEHLLVLGGGYIALEFGQMFRRFGSKVTILQRSGQLLSREDPDVALEIASILEGEDIEVRLKTRATRFEQDGEGQIVATVESAQGQETIRASQLLVAVGRVPVSGGLNLEAAGIETDERGFISVNDRLETNVPGVYCMGDANGGPAFTHISYDDYRILRDNLLEGADANTKGRFVPYTVFIDPELGRVGLTEEQAKSKKLNFRVAKLPMTRVARALESDETRGFMKALIDPESRQILGCAILGVHGGEVMAVLQVAMMGKLPYTAIKEGTFAHPTLAESLNNLFMTLDH